MSASVYDAIQDLPEDKKKEINEALGCEREERENDRKFNDLSRRIDVLEKSLTEVRLKVFNIPQELNTDGSCKLQLV